ncbi:hypothetical protein M8J71_11375 [Pseudarthrobacter sp. R1]|uniref:hypothetical protein n=1 Tax=Pseudarthrobacter sp. R1 TaxID=2944934 RepID=UPI002108E91B|nr:hypothetical protein [Pseudarthrobacter sp. R1]MCQ6271081.1 hypothetical protein [Pseudarthrobacter sp. R1]
MSVPNYARFLSDCFLQDRERQPALREDDIYGVYVSWCLLNGQQPGPVTSLWAAMDQRGYMKQHHDTGRHEWPGLSLKGPAAVDYILTSQPSLL